MAMLGDIVELSVVVRDLDEAAARFTRLFGLSVHRRAAPPRALLSVDRGVARLRRAAPSVGGLGAISWPPCQSGGRRSAQGCAASKAAAARSTPASSRQRPTICNPTGSPDFVKPAGTEIAGRPTTVKA